MVTSMCSESAVVFLVSLSCFEFAVMFLVSLWCFVISCGVLCFWFVNVFCSYKPPFKSVKFHIVCYMEPSFYGWSNIRSIITLVPGAIKQYCYSLELT